MRGQARAEDVRDLSTQEVQAKAGFDQLLKAAATDSNEVAQRRREWERYQGLAAELANTMESWRETFADLQAMDIERLLPGVDAFGADARSATRPDRRYICG